MTTPKSVTANKSSRKPRAERTFKASSKIVNAAIVESIQGLREYWPLTVRQVYYQLVKNLVIENNIQQYKRVSNLLTSLRIQKTVPWTATEDRSRRSTKSIVHSDHVGWLQKDLKQFANFRYYGRCMVQDQTVYVEVATEKDALSSIIEDSMAGFCTTLNILRGHNSASMQHEIAERFKEKIGKGKTPILLHLGDLDPSGVSIPKAMKRTFLEDHGVDLDIRRVALTPEQVIEYKLPSTFDAAKKTDPNYKAFVAEYGEDQHAVELDALHPKDLTFILRSALRDVYDMDAIDANKEAEREEDEIIKIVKRDIVDFLEEKHPRIFAGGDYFS